MLSSLCFSATDFLLCNSLLVELLKKIHNCHHTCVWIVLFFFFFQTLPKTAALEVAEVGRVKSASDLCHTLSLGPDGALIGIFPQNIFFSFYSYWLFSLGLKTRKPERTQISTFPIHRYHYLMLCTRTNKTLFLSNSTLA